MARTREETVLRDDDGGEHSYAVEQHPADEGFKLLPRLLEAVGAPLGQLLTALRPGSGGTGIGALSGPGGLLEADLAGVDLGSALTALARGVAAQGGLDLVREVLRYTVRDGQPLSDSKVFAHAFQGNYGELGLAVAWALGVNYGKALRRPFGLRPG